MGCQAPVRGAMTGVARDRDSTPPSKPSVHGPQFRVYGRYRISGSNGSEAKAKRLDENPRRLQVSRAHHACGKKENKKQVGRAAPHPPNSPQTTTELVDPVKFRKSKLLLAITSGNNSEHGIPVYCDR